MKTRVKNALRRQGIHNMFDLNRRGNMQDFRGIGPKTEEEVRRTMLGIFSMKNINPNRLEKEDLIVLVMPHNSRYHGTVAWAPKGADIYDCNQMFTARYRLRFRRTGRTELIEGYEAVVFEFDKIIRVQSKTTTYDSRN